MYYFVIKSIDIRDIPQSGLRLFQRQPCQLNPSDPLTPEVQDITKLNKDGNFERLAKLEIVDVDDIWYLSLFTKDIYIRPVEIPRHPYPELLVQRCEALGIIPESVNISELKRYMGKFRKYKIFSSYPWAENSKCIF